MSIEKLVLQFYFDFVRQPRKMRLYKPTHFSIITKTENVPSLKSASVFSRNDKQNL